MQEAGIFDQDILVVDRSLSPGHGDIKPDAVVTHESYNFV